MSSRVEPFVVVDAGEMIAHELLSTRFQFVVSSVRGPDKLENEDGALVLQLDDASSIVVVVDGMGGMKHGVAATRAAIGACEARLSQWTPGASRRAALVDAFEDAHRAVLDAAPGGGATAVGALVTDEFVQFAHAGDAEGLAFGQRGLLKHRTRSHSPVSYALEAGVIDEDEAFVHPERNVVSNGLGLEGMTIEIGPRVELSARDTVVLTSDGLTDNLEADEVIEVFRAGPLVDRVRRAVEESRHRMATSDRGKPDDLTTVAIRRRAPR